MRNLWIFISKYNATFLFIIFFVISLVLTVQHNAYQRASALNSANALVGTTYEKVNGFKSYLNLRNVNDSLASENARLRGMLKSSPKDDSLIQRNVTDTANKQQYSYTVAKVVKNSVTLTSNIITINKGKDAGFVPDMAVIAPNRGVVGYIKDVSEHFSTIQSLLHKDSRISAGINHSFGILRWGDDNVDIYTARLEEVPNHIKIKVGDTVYSSSYSKFPTGIPIGRIKKTNMASSKNFLTAEVALFTDFSTLEYVYVVKNKLQDEQDKLEEQSGDE